jgi:hypothetical protein
MTTKFLIGVLVGSALLLAQRAVVGTAAPVAAMAINPIPGVDVIVKKKPGGTVVRTKSDGSGSFSLDTLAPGNYELEFEGNSLSTAISKIDPQSKGPDHVIRFTLAALPLTGMTPLISREEAFHRGVKGQNVSVPFTIPADPTPGGPADKRKHSYIGTVTLVR